MATLTDEQAYRRHERSVLAMLSTRYRELDPDGRREIYHEAWASVFIALGGTSYAVSTIGTKQIKNNSVRSVDVRNGTLSSRDVKRGSLGGRAVKESALGTVPRAGRVGGKTAAQLALRCPSGMVPNMDSCIEPKSRPALAYGLARVACEFARRRLPSYQELTAYTDDTSGALASGGELTATVYPPQASETVRALVVTDQSGGVATVPDTFAGGKAFRCAANAING